MATFPNLIEVSEPEAFFILMHGEAFEQVEYSPRLNRRFLQLKCIRRRLCPHDASMFQIFGSGSSACRQELPIVSLRYWQAVMDARKVAVSSRVHASGKLLWIVFVTQIIRQRTCAVPKSYKRTI